MHADLFPMYRCRTCARPFGSPEARADHEDSIHGGRPPPRGPSVLVRRA